MLQAGIQGAQAVERAIAILRAVALLQRRGASLATIMLATGLSRSTAFRLLRCLVEQRLLNFDDAHKFYFIGPLAYELGLAGKGLADDLAARWRKRLERISAQTALTAYLVARSDTDIVCLDTVQAETAIRAVPLAIGQRLPLGVGAGSLAILSSLADDEIEAIIAANHPMLRMYGRGLLTPAELHRRIARTRAKGYAYSSQSVAQGVVGVGVVIPGPDQITQLAISVSMVGTQIKEPEQERLIDAMRQELGAGTRAGKPGLRADRGDAYEQR
jgi:DNA-binding IclR family transcriptional regulator